MSLPEPTCIIPRSFQRYHVEVSEVRYPCAQHRRWWKANPCPKPHYEAIVIRGGVRRSDGGWKQRGHECAGPGWDDVFGRTPAEAVSKARKLARAWVRWQLSLGLALIAAGCDTHCQDTIHSYPPYVFSCPADTAMSVEEAAPGSKSFHIICRCRRNSRDGGGT